VSPERPEDDDFLEDEEQEEYGQRSIFATGWFRAVLVLLVLAVIAVIAVPLIGGWFEPTPPPKVTTTRPVEPTPAPLPTPTPAPTPPPATPAPATPPPAAQLPTPAPTPPPATPAPVPPPPAVSAPPARPEMPAPATPSRAAETAKAPERAASASSGKSASKATAANGSYWVQVGAFKESKNAEGLARTLRSEGFTVQVASVTRGEPLHVVRVGGYPDRGKATAARDELQGKGHSGFVMQGPAK
jgi:septal ring-binding cell division protein DamX